MPRPGATAGHGLHAAEGIVEPLDLTKRLGRGEEIGELIRARPAVVAGEHLPRPRSAS